MSSVIHGGHLSPVKHLWVVMLGVVLVVVLVVVLGVLRNWAAMRLSF